MSDLFATGRVVDGIIAMMLLELIVLIIVRKKTGNGLQTRALLASLGAGAALLMSLRAALAGYSWHAVASWLIAALCAHWFDLKERWTAR